jgi:pyridoxine 4-dehydrogenase
MRTSKDIDRSPAVAASTITLGHDLTVNRMGFGAMRLTGEGVWGPPADRPEAIRVLRRAVEMGVNFIDAADSYGPNVAEELIAEALQDAPSPCAGSWRAAFAA